MGLSASQARLLSITARLSDNELHSQSIANAKVCLADKTQEASREYIEALNSKKLVFTTYDAKGNSTQVGLTAALLYEYGDMKNQYGITNASGQLLVNNVDAKNFENSENLGAFLEKYGVETIINPAYEEYYKSLYGEDYEKFMGQDSLSGLNKQFEKYGGKGVLGWVNDWDFTTSESAYNSWLGRMQSATKDIPGGTSGLYGQLVDKLKNAPMMAGTEPHKKTPDLETLPQHPTVTPTQVPEQPDFKNLKEVYLNSACNSSVESTSGNSRVWHIEHNLCHLIWGTNGLGTEASGNRTSITNSTGTITIVPASGISKNSLTSGFGGSGADAATGLLAALNDENIQDIQYIKDLKQKLIDLYCDVVNYLHQKNASQMNTGSYTIQTSPNILSVDDLYAKWKEFYDVDLANAQQACADAWEVKKNRIEAENQARQDAADAIWQAECDRIKAENKAKEQAVEDEYKAAFDAWQEQKLAGEQWKAECEALINKFTEEVPSKEIPDPNDAKGQWYTNLWHRMNGEYESKSVDGVNKRYYKELDIKLLNSQEWLKFALEHGVVTMEQVKYVNPAEDGTGLENTIWQSTVYTSCVDISTVDDEAAIARAEAIYKHKLNEIEIKDKKYDNDIKKLDTEHNALQTEYESVKEVINKNVERSFKAFS